MLVPNPSDPYHCQVPYSPSNQLGNLFEKQCCAAVIPCMNAISAWRSGVILSSSAASQQRSWWPCLLFILWRRSVSLKAILWHLKGCLLQVGNSSWSVQLIAGETGGPVLCIYISTVTLLLLHLFCWTWPMCLWKPYTMQKSLYGSKPITLQYAVHSSWLAQRMQTVSVHVLSSLLDITT